MNTLRNPKWLFLINTLPLLVLAALFFSQYQIISTLLEEDSVYIWKVFSLILGILATVNLGYACYLTFTKQNVPVYYGIIALLCYTAYVYMYAFNLESIFPSNLPQWMISGNIFLYVGTFLMPTIAYSLFVIVLHFTAENTQAKAWINFLITVSIPVLVFLFTQVLFPLWQPLQSFFNIHAILILLISLTIVFLFFLIRGLYIVVTRKISTWQKYQLTWKIPLSFILPLVGLLLNNGLLFPDFLSTQGAMGIFGDFRHAMFYILAGLNGVFLCLPNIENKIYRLTLFVGRAITLAFTLYFFLVFLPFLPLSILAITAFGLGFLMLTPSLLFIIHLNELSVDYTYLQKSFPGRKKALIAVSLVAFLAIPISISGSYLRDRSILNETLEYLYSPDYSKDYDIDKSSLRRTLEVVKHHKEKPRAFALGDQTPYLSAYFNWLVLDNLTLSDAKINHIEKIFFGSSTLNEVRPADVRDPNVEISQISTTSTYDETQHAWRTWVHLQLSNTSRDARMREYSTTINLPDGCWISDYYLYVGEKKEPGILAEKKAALWVFSNIRNENRDPGILYYLTGNRVAFRVFPFSNGETRRTGIELLHKEPVILTIDNRTITLGDSTRPANTGKTETENMAYVSSRQKENLKSVQRKHYLHFLVDASAGKNDKKADFMRRIESVLQKNPGSSERSKISFVDTYVHTFPIHSNWKQHYQSRPFEGGFNLDLAIKKTLYAAYTENSYPIIAVVSDALSETDIDKNIADLSFAIPESKLFYRVAEDGSFKTHSLIDHPTREITAPSNPSFEQSVLIYEFSDHTRAYLPNDNGPSVILRNHLFEVPEGVIQERSWHSALTLQGKWMSQVLHPETSDEEWLTLVKYSFISKVLTPVTSYLVVENEAQRVILKKKQDQVLRGNKNLDLDEEPQRMSEPSVWILIALLGLFFGYKGIRRRRRKMGLDRNVHAKG